MAMLFSVRGRGEGSIHEVTIRRKLADGSVREHVYWRVALSLGVRNGRRQRPQRYYRTKGEAVKALREARSSISAPSSVGAYLGRWLDDVAAPRLRATTLERYRSIVDQHLVPALGTIKLGDLQVSDVSAYVADRLREASPRTVQQEHAVLARCLHDAERAGDVPRNVARLAGGPRVPRAERAVLDAEQARLFLAGIREHRLWPLLVLCRTVGLRQGEALGLRWDDWQERTLSVRHTLQQRGGRWVLDEPKSERSRRTITLPASAIEALREQRRRQLAERVGNKRWNERDLVFTDSRGEPLDGTRVTREFQRLLRSRKLPAVTFHSLRHLAATTMLAAGVSMDEVKRILGHSTIAVTVDIYSHRVASVGQDAADRTERAL